MPTFRKGQRVRWRTPQGMTRGRIIRKLTTGGRVKGHDYTASEDDPQYLVQSDKSGAEAAHKPESLEPATGADDRG